jgi:2,4'-dihydroxyacetophenone dioxygenase
MAIATFSTVNDGLQPNQKERGHYVVDVNLEESGPWIPYAEGVWVQLCRFNVTTGGFTVVLKGLLAAKLGVITTLALCMVLRYVVTGGI